VAANPQTKPIDLDCETAENDLLLVKIGLLVKIWCIFGLLFLFILCMLLPTGE